MSDLKVFRLVIDAEILAENIDDVFRQLGTYYLALSGRWGDSSGIESPFVAGSAEIKTKEDMP